MRYVHVEVSKQYEKGYTTISWYVHAEVMCVERSRMASVEPTYWFFKFRY